MLVHADLVLAILIMMVLAFLYEGLKAFRDALTSFEMKKKNTSVQDGEQEGLLSGSKEGYVCNSL